MEEKKLVCIEVYVALCVEGLPEQFLFEEKEKGIYITMQKVLLDRNCIVYKNKSSPCFSMPAQTYRLHFALSFDEGEFRTFLCPQFGFGEALISDYYAQFAPQSGTITQSVNSVVNYNNINNMVYVEWHFCEHYDEV